MEKFEEELISEFSKSNTAQRVYYPSKSRPTTSLDYMKFNSEDYLKFKFEEKVRSQINSLNLDQRLIKEIANLSFYYCKLFKKTEEVKLKKSDIISIVAFKIIKKYSMPFTHNEIYEKIKLDKGKYLKYSHLFKIEKDFGQFEIKADQVNDSGDFKHILLPFPKQDEENEKNQFIKETLHFLNFMINKLSNYYSMNPNVFKIISSNIQIEDYLKKIASCFQVKTKNENKKIIMQPTHAFYDNIKLLEETRKEGKELIINKFDHDFYSFFHNKILIDSLSGAMIKLLMESRGVKINLETFREIFKISTSGISRGMKMLKEYLKLNNM